MPFTVRQLDALKAEKTFELFEPDARMRGLCIRVSPTGRKVWSFHYTHASKRKRLDLGSYPAFSLAEAHNRAKQFRLALDSNPPIDPASIVAEETAAAAGVLTVNDLIREYAADVRRSPKPIKTIGTIEKILNNQVGKHIGHVKLTDLTRLHIKGIIDRAQDRRKFSMAIYLHSKLKILFTWAVQSGHMDSNPALQMVQPQPVETKENARPLRANEIAVFWHGVQGLLKAPYARILKLSMVCGARLSEVVQLDASQIKDGIWTIPESKNGKAHSIPLNSLMLELIGNTDIGSPWGEAIKTRQVSDAFYGIDVPAKLDLPDFTAHSMRRSTATHMDELGIAESTIGLCLNHAAPRTAKTATKTYIKPSVEELARREKIKMDQKRLAFNAWADRLREIVA